MLRFRTGLVLIAAIAGLVSLWQRAEPQHVTSPDSRKHSNATIAPAATGTDDGMPLRASTADDRSTIAAPVVPDSGGTASSAAAAGNVRSASVRLDVHAPPSARVGDLVTIT